MSDAYQPKTDVELEQVAQDIVGGRVFHSFYQKDAIEKAGLTIMNVFMPLAFASDEYVKWMEDNKITAAYEYLEKAGPRAINGLPAFFSCAVLSEKDSERLHIRVHDIWKQRLDRLNAAALEGEETGPESPPVPNNNVEDANDCGKIKDTLSEEVKMFVIVDGDGGQVGRPYDTKGDAEAELANLVAAGTATSDYSVKEAPAAEGHASGEASDTEEVTD